MKKINKINAIEFDLDFVKELAKKSKLSAAVKRKIRAHAKDTVQHFKNDKWDLDYSLLNSDLLVELLGYNPEFQFLSEIANQLKKPIYLRGTEKGLVLSIKKEKKK